MSAIREHSIGVPADTGQACCGVYVQQVNRIARLSRQIQIWSQESPPTSIDELRLAITRKQRMERWLAAHTHETSPTSA